jgi:membrane fusion protein, multidrug efflux system
MKAAFTQSSPRSLTRSVAGKPGARAWAGSAAALAILAGAVIGGPHLLAPRNEQAARAPLPVVTVSTPLQRNVDSTLQFLGQFSAIDSVELRAQVGGTLTQIAFKDGAIVHEGDLLFVIDPTPYQIKLNEATAQLQTARARFHLANRELVRAEKLKRTGFGTIENADQRVEEQRADQAAVDNAQALVQDARFDLDHCRITAPFTGRIGSHLVSVGNLIAGSRAASSPTTLLATLVSIDPIYLNFDMSEADYMTFLRYRQQQKGPLADKVKVALSDEKRFTRKGTLDFIDNTLDRSSGTIHARATIPNSDLLLTPGGFARVRLEVAPPVPALLVPDASVLPDQSGRIVLTVGPNDVVTPKQVQLGDFRDGLRVIRSGLSPTDRVIVDGIPMARPGAQVSPVTGSISLADQSRGLVDP